jgi:hypothetical protein
MIEQIFLNVIERISDSRCWLMPLLLVCTLVLLVDEIRSVFIDMSADMKGESDGKK